MDQPPVFLAGLSYDDYTKSLFSTLVQATRLSNQIPDTDEYSYYTASLTFPARMKDLGQRLLHKGQQIISHTANTGSNLTDIDPVHDDLADRFTSDVVEALDLLLEQVDNFLDGKDLDVAKTQVVAKTVLFRERGQKDREIIHAKNILRPQEAWRHRIDNSYGVFVPRLTSKPNARQPLDEIFLKKTEVSLAKENTKSVSKAMELHLSNLGLNKSLDSTNSISFSHPYDYELQHYTPLPDQLTPCKETLYLPLDETPLTWITTPQQVKNLVALLKQQTEFAVDLEHHSYRTWQGFTCLIQISTRQEDFLVDPLVLMDDLEILNEVFADPSIVKVLHGADSDVLWLQRDFGVYIVNMFDTGQASRVLEMSSHRLSSLLSHYCNVNVDKKYQLADWRIRPLPAELEKYAREDTHYLLYVYDRLRNEAIARGNESNNLLNVILSRSRDICRTTYEKEQIDSQSYLTLYNKFGDILSEQQLRVFAAVFFWRDRVAREEDESVRYVLPDKMLFNIAKIIPVDTNQLLICCTPTPPLLRVHANDVVLLIQDALENNVNLGPSKKNEAAETPAVETPKQTTVSLPLPIQLRKNDREEKRPSVPILFSKSNLKSSRDTLFASSDSESMDEELKNLVESIKGSIATDFFSVKVENPARMDEEEAVEIKTDSRVEVEEEEEVEVVEEKPAPKQKPSYQIPDEPKQLPKSISERYNLKTPTMKTKQQLQQEKIAREEARLKRPREGAESESLADQKRRKK